MACDTQRIASLSFSFAQVICLCRVFALNLSFTQGGHIWQDVTGTYIPSGDLGIYRKRRGLLPQLKVNRSEDDGETHDGEHSFVPMRPSPRLFKILSEIAR